MSPRQRRIAWLGAVLCAVLCAVMGALWLAVGYGVDRRTNPPRVEAESAVSIALSRVDTKGAPASSPAPAPAPAPATSANIRQPVTAAQPLVSMAGSAAAGRPASAPNPVPAALDLCGVGRVPVPQDFAASAAIAGGPGALLVLAGPMGDGALQVARSRTLAALPSTGPLGRAVGLVHQGPAGADELVALARQSSNPTVLRFGLTACTRSASPAACHTTLAREWTRLEPNNAAAWLAWSSDPAAAGPAAQDDVRSGLRQSTTFKDHLNVLPGVVLAAVPADVPAYLQLGLATQALGVQLGLANDYIGRMFKRCKPPWPAGTNRQAECEHLAELMVNHGDSQFAHVAGASLGEMVGWPATRLAALQAEQSKLDQVMSSARLHSDPLSCRVVMPLLKMFSDGAQMGELAAARAYAQGRGATSAAPAPQPVLRNPAAMPLIDK